MSIQGNYPETVRLSSDTLALIEAEFMSPRDTWDDAIRKAIDAQEIEV